VKRAEGDPKRVIGAYVTDVERQEEQFLAATDAKAKAEAGDAAVQSGAGPAEAGDAAANMFGAGEGRWGSGTVEISAVVLETAEGTPTHVYHTGEAMRLRLRLRAQQPVDDFVFGIGIFNADGVCVYGTNTDLEEYEAERLSGEADVTFAIAALDLVEGTYKLDVAVHKKDGAPYDYHRLLYTFRVKSRVKDIGIYRPAHSWAFSDGVKFKRRVGS
jgi:hypothetical protein